MKKLFENFRRFINEDRAAELGLGHSREDYEYIFTPIKDDDPIGAKLEKNPVILNMDQFITASLNAQEEEIFKHRVEKKHVILCADRPPKGFPKCSDLKKQKPKKSKEDLYKNKKSINNLKLQGFRVVVDSSDINFQNWSVLRTLESLVNEINTKNTDPEEPMWVQVEMSRKNWGNKPAFVMTAGEILNSYSPEALRAARDIDSAPYL